MLKQVQILDIYASIIYFTVIMLKYLNDKLTHLVLEMLTLLKRCVSLDRPGQAHQGKTKHSKFQHLIVI